MADIQKLKKMHTKYFGDQKTDLFTSPGRIEIVGNHTDHNGGKVLCAAISLLTTALVAKTDDGIIQIKSEGYNILKVDTSKIEFSEKELSTSKAIVKGVVDYFVKNGKNVGGFTATMTSNVPKGAGVSSSSSFEVMIAEILNVYYNNSTIDSMTKAKASQYAENAFFGKPCGLMDQSAIALGDVNMIDFKSSEPIVESAPWCFDDLDIFVVATGGDHSDLTADYAEILDDMRAVSAVFDKKQLADIDHADFKAKGDEIKTQLGDRAYLRAKHFFEENDVVIKAVSAIRHGDRQAFLDAVNQSGRSSENQLKNIYSATGKNENLQNGLSFALTIDGVLAHRVHGGGFAGTMLIFADSNLREVVTEKFNSKFGAENVNLLSISHLGATEIRES